MQSYARAMLSIIQEQALIACEGDLAKADQPEMGALFLCWS